MNGLRFIGKSMVVFALAAAFVSPTYIESKTKYCTASYYTDVLLNDTERAALRNSSQIPLTYTMSGLSSFATTYSVGGLMSGGGASLIGVVVIFVLALISTVLFFVFCCCWQTAANPSTAKTKWLCIASTVLWFIYLGVLIAILVYFTKIRNSLDYVNCGVASVPYDTLEGVNQPSLQFIGLKNLRTLVDTFNLEIANLGSKSDSFDSITSQNLPESTVNIKSALKSFYTTFQQKTTSDGAGNSTKPITVQELTEYVNDPIKVEYNTYDNVAVKLNNAAKKGKTYANSAVLASTQSYLKNVTALLDSYITDTTSMADTVVTGFDTATSYTTAIYWIILGLGLAMLVASGVSLFILMCMYSKERCLDCGKVIKTLLIVCGIALTLFSVFALGFLALSMGVGTICNFISGILTTTDAQTFMKQLDLQSNLRALNMISYCVPQSSDGNLANLIGEPAGPVYGDIQSFLDGMTTYEIFRTTIDQSSDIPSVDNTATYWGKYKSGLYYNHLAIAESIKSFNNIVVCGATYYTLNLNNCTKADNFNCIELSTVKSFNPPDCTSKLEESKAIFVNIKLYMDENKVLLTDMTSQLSGTSSSTPKSLFQAAKTNFLNINSKYLAARNAIPQTMTIATRINKAFASAASCTILKLEAQNLENVLCFTLNVSMFYFSILAVANTVVLLIGVWLLCLGLRYYKVPALDGDVSAMSFEQTQSENMVSQVEQRALKST